MVTKSLHVSFHCASANDFWYRLQKPEVGADSPPPSTSNRVNKCTYVYGTTSKNTTNGLAHSRKTIESSACTQSSINKRGTDPWIRTQCGVLYFLRCSNIRKMWSQLRRNMPWYTGALFINTARGSTRGKCIFHQMCPAKYLYHLCTACHKLENQLPRCVSIIDFEQFFLP